MVATNSALLGDFFFGVKSLATLTIPAFVASFVNIRLKLRPDILRRADVVTVGRANKIRIGSVHFVHQGFEILNCLVDIFLWRKIVFLSFLCDFVAVLICSNLKTNFVTFLTLMSSPDVSNQIIQRVADVWCAVRIRNCGCDIEFFLHTAYNYSIF